MKIENGLVYETQKRIDLLAEEVEELEARGANFAQAVNNSSDYSQDLTVGFKKTVKDVGSANRDITNAPKATRKQLGL